MAERNGYFQLIFEDGNAKVRIIPPVDGGKSVSTSEVSDYLTNKSYNFSITDLNRAISTRKEEFVEVNNPKIFPEQEMLKVVLKEDGMKAYARFYAPSNDGDVMSYDEIIRDLNLKKVTVGIKEDVIRQFVADRLYCTDILIAEGIPVREGRNGFVEYLFDTELDTKPTLNEDGSVDFFHLNAVCHCAKGQVLARLIKEDPGEAGSNVMGEKKSPREVKKETLSYGRNIVLSEDRLEISAEIDGHVQLIDGKVFVSGVLEIQNVDPSTGNLDYDGDIVIQGNVMTGFSVKTNGNIEVKGVVEGAILEAGGNITLSRGVNGMSRGKLTAKGNIISKFIENATVSAGGFVETDCILHSKVSAFTRVTVQGRRGFITGGTVRAGEVVEAKTLGSAMGVDTVIEVGTDPEQKERLALLQGRVMETKKMIATTEPVLVAVGQKIANGERLSRMKVLSQNLLAQKEQLKNDTMEMNELSVAFDKDTEAVVRVMGEAYPGTRIIISESSLVLHEMYHYCRFIREEGEVVMAAM